MTPALLRARLLTLLLPAALLAGAWGSQLIGHLYPCEMCHWQRWPHYGALVVALAAFALPRAARPLVLLAAMLILASGAIGVFHAGVEYHWWRGLTRCTQIGPATPGGDFLHDMLQVPLIRCDVAQWTLLGISLAGWNALFSIGGAIAITMLCLKPPR